MNENALSFDERIKFITALESNVQILESDILRKLKRDATHSYVSVVCITPAEQYFSIHKSGDVKLLSSKQFLRLGKGAKLNDDNVVISNYTDEQDFYFDNDDEISLIRYTQSIRNKFLSNSFNTEYVGLPDYSGNDPLPKELMREAAKVGYKILNENSSRRVDLRVGLNFIIECLQKDGTRSEAIRKKIESRMLGRGAKAVITRNELLHLSEILFQSIAPTLKSRRSVLDSIVKANLSGLSTSASSVN